MVNLKKVFTILLFLCSMAACAQHSGRTYSLSVAVRLYYPNGSITYNETGDFWDWYIDSANICVASIDGKISTCHLTDTLGITKRFTGLHKKVVVICSKPSYDTARIAVDLSKPRDSTIVISTDSASKQCGWGWSNSHHARLYISLSRLPHNKNSKHGLRYIYSGNNIDKIDSLDSR